MRHRCRSRRSKMDAGPNGMEFSIGGEDSSNPKDSKKIVQEGPSHPQQATNRREREHSTSSLCDSSGRSVGVGVRASVSNANHGLGPGHDLLRSGAIVWCRICGAYGELRFKDLKVLCTGPTTGMRASQLARLKKGEHPLRNGERLPRPTKFRGFS